MPTSKSDLASGGLDGDRLELLGGGQQLGIEPAQLADRRLILPDGGALSGRAGRPESTRIGWPGRRECQRRYCRPAARRGEWLPAT
jgi:hypothetical protein